MLETRKQNPTEYDNIAEGETEDAGGRQAPTPWRKEDSREDLSDTVEGGW